MKLRQKLAVVLATAMVVTAVPVVTMAASTNSISRETIKVAKNFEFKDATTANAVKIAFKDSEAGATEVFYLKLTNAKWLDIIENQSNAVYQKQSDDVVKVTYTVKAGDATTPVKFPLLVEVTGGDATVEVEPIGSNSLISKGSWLFATTGEKKVSYKLGDAPAFYRDGKIADVTFTETFTGSMGTTSTTDGKVSYDLEIDNDDFIFDEAGSDVKVKGVYGFFNRLDEDDDVSVDWSNASKGKITVTVTVPAGTNQDSRGEFKISGIAVKSTTKTPDDGDLLIDIKGKDVADAKDNLVFAKVAKYATYIKMADDKAVEIAGGNIKDVKFTIGETVEDSMVGGREFEIKIDDAHFDWKTLVAEYGTLKDADGNTTTDKTKANKKKSNGELNVADMYEDGVISDAKFKIGTVETKLIDRIYFDTKADGEIIDGTLIVELHQKAQINANVDKMTFKVPVCVPISNKDKEKAVITASGRALENEVTVDAVTIKNPLNITSESATVKVGLMKQATTGKVVLAETDKEVFKKGGDITLKIKDINTGAIKVTDATFTVDGEIKKVENTKNADNLVFTINRSSKAAATLTVSDLKFTVDRTVPEGSYDLEISGAGIDADGHSITIKDFLVVGTPNTQDITSAGLAKGTAKFVIGEATYTLNDTQKAMDAPSYIQDPGYTMVPVRYVAQAFGVSEKDILFGSGTVTIFAGERTISLTSNSNTALVNGNPVVMGTKVVIKDGRTYVPAGEIARLLGISTAWDATTKTATFTN